MAFTFYEFLRRRNLTELTDLGIDLSDPKVKDAFLAQLQKDKVDLKKAAANVNANPDVKPDKAQLQATQQAQLQQDILAGKATPTGVKASDWETSVGLLTPTGSAVPNEIGRGKPAVDVGATLKTGMEQGGLPANTDKLRPAWMKKIGGKPPVAAVTPEVDPTKPMTPADKAKAKSQPGVKASA